MVKLFSPALGELLLVSFLPLEAIDRCEPKDVVEDSSDTLMGSLVHCSVIFSLLFVKCCDSSEVTEEFCFIEHVELFNESLSPHEFVDSNPWASVSSTEEDVSVAAVVHGVVCGVGTKVGPLPLEG